jgi:hypothetical protein
MMPVFVLCALAEHGMRDTKEQKTQTHQKSRESPYSH